MRRINLVLAILCWLVLATHASAFTPMAASGTAHTLFLSESGLVHAVGANGSGQLGDGTTTPSASPVVASGLANVVMVAAGSTHSLALKSDGTVWAWGKNDAGQLGIDPVATPEQHSPVQVPGLADIVAIAAGDRHSIALASNGNVYAWGSNSSAQTGGPCGSTAANTTVPTLVYANSSGPPCTPGTPFGSVTQIAAGAQFNVALRSDGTVWAWGDNAFSQLGSGGSDPNSPVPVAIAIGAGPGVTVTQIAAGGAHAIALKSDTRAVAWGRNNAGQLGDNTMSDSAVPVDVSVSTSLPPFSVPTKAIASVGAGAEHSLIVYQTGPAASFGNGSSGQLGTGLTTSVPVAVEFGGYSEASGVYAGPMANRTFVYRPGRASPFGRFESTGNNGSGELGQGAAGADVLAPAAVTAVTAVGDKIGKRTNFRIDASQSDLFWRHSSGVNVTWDFTGSAPTAFSSAGLPGVGSGWQALASTDIDGDGRSDVVWLETATGNVAIWFMGGPGTVASVTVPHSIGPGSTLVFAGAGDLDGDGHGDLVWRDTTTGAVVVWYFGVGGRFEQALTVGTVSPASWQIVAIGDVNGDWIDDLIWFRASDGQVAIWRMARTGSFAGLFPGAVGPGSAWRIYRAGDYDGDGRVDLFWRNTADGTNAVWFFAGGNQIAAAQFYVGTPLAEWRIDATGDFDGDGRDDLMWSNMINGVTVRWLMTPRGGTPTAQPVVGVGPGWTAVQ